MFAETLKTIRMRKGISQADLADRLNIVRQTVARWENGISVPDAAALQELAAELDVPVSVLLGGDMEGAQSNDEICEKLASINEALSIRNRRSRLILKWIIALFIALIVTVSAISILNMVRSGNVTAEPKTFSSSSLLSDE